MSNVLKYRQTPKGVLTNIYDHQKRRRSVYYTLKELHAKFLNDPKFNRLHTEWVKSGFKKDKKPSIDRISHKEPYTLRNIHCITWEENRYKQRMEFKSIRARAVYMMRNGEVVNIFSSQHEAVKSTGLRQSNISLCLSGRRKTCGGYQWQYEDSNIHTIAQPST